MIEKVPTTPKAIQEAADAAFAALSQEERALRDSQIKKLDNQKLDQQQAQDDVVPVFGGSHFSS